MKQRFLKMLFFACCALLPIGTLKAEFKAVIFDCDGVLVDTEGLKFRAWQIMFAAHEIELQPKDYSPLAGLSGDVILESLCKKKKILPAPLMLRAKEVVYKRLQKEGVLPCPQMILVLKALSEKRDEGEIVIGLASSAAKEEILKNLNEAKILPYFDAIVSGQEDLSDYEDPSGTNKPKPYIYEQAAKLLGVDPEECLVFEDTEAGVIAARLAGCYVVAVPNDWTASQDFSSANIIFRSVDSEALVDWLEEMLKPE